MDTDVYGFVDEGRDDSWICENPRELDVDCTCGVYPHDVEAGFPKDVNTELLGERGSTDLSFSRCSLQLGLLTDSSQSSFALSLEVVVEIGCSAATHLDLTQ